MEIPKDTNVHVITQYRDDGKSEFVPAADQTAPALQIVEGVGAVQDIYQTVGFPPAMTSTTDITASMNMRQQGLGTDRITVDNGFVTEVVHIQPGASSPMHRTRTLDLIIVVEGSVELELDDGEKRVFGRGDSIVLRGAGHKWTNVSGEGQWVKLFSVTVDAKPIQVGGRVLEESWEL